MAKPNDLDKRLHNEDYKLLQNILAIAASIQRTCLREVAAIQKELRR